MTRGPEDAKIPDRFQAQRRTDRIRAFREELAQVEGDGVLLLTEEQRRRLRRYQDDALRHLARRYDVDVTPAERQVSIGVRGAAWLGVLALSAAAAFFLRAAWPDLPTAARCLALTAPPLGATLAAGACATSARLTCWVSPLALAAFGGLTAGLLLLGGLFNAPPSPFALLAAGAFGTALGYGLGLRSLLAVGLLAGAGFAVAGPAAAVGIDWTSLWLRPEPFVAPGVALLGLSAFLGRGRQGGFDAVYRGVGLLLLLGPLAVLTVWGEGSLLPLPRTRVEALYQAAGLLTAGASFGVGLWRRWPETVQIGASALLALLCAILYDWWWAALPRYLYFLALASAALALVVALQGLRALSRREAP